jgi:hypothetical protein
MCVGMTRTGNRTQGAIMLNGKSHQEHFTDDPADIGPTRPRARRSGQGWGLEDRLRPRSLRVGGGSSQAGATT